MSHRKRDGDRRSVNTEILFFAACDHWVRNSRRFIVSQRTWDATRKAAVFKALGSLIAERARVPYAPVPLWQMTFYDGSYAFVFAGPRHRLVISKEPGAPVCAGAVPARPVRSVDGWRSFYEQWQPEPVRDSLRLLP
jgi:hypothetical protein